MSCSMQPDYLESRPSSFLIADWTPLDELTEAFSDFGKEATSALALQAVGTAFLALWFEVSAHKHYTLAYHGLWGHVPSTIIQGLDQALTDVEEATKQWGSVVLWLERLSEQEPAQVDTLRLHFDALIQDHQQHLWNLRLRLYHERESMRLRIAQPSSVSHQREGQHS